MNLTHEKYWELLKEADARMKKSNGHSFIQILKTRCDKCGRSPNQKGKCPGWVNKLFDEFWRLLVDQKIVDRERSGGK